MLAYQPTVSQSSPMTSIPDLLQLLNPWELPQSLDLEPSEQALVASALQKALEALNQTDDRRALATIETALKSLGSINGLTLPIENSKTSLQAWEIEDYDRFFKIQHVETDTPELCIIQGFLLVIQSFLSLSLENEHLSEQDLIQQRQGFIIYANLLARVFNLTLT